ncbi:hypothetical protein DL93DRAFT_2223687 [Clavulina sp. PMI_390]|nr:hypothetical protein DL93DRAFT_2223687 [Clavulina sp. PMI_390]
MASTGDVVPVTVLLPSHSYTLTISDLAPGATVADLKRAISEQCPGNPQVSGQRVIMQGRLLADDEVLPQAEPRVVHLAVHPGSWTTSPPSSPRATAAGLPSVAPVVNSPPVYIPPPSNEPPLPLTLQLSSLPTEFVTHFHANALRILSGQRAAAWPGPMELSHARRIARTVIKYAGLGWPPVLDEDLPTDVDPGKGVQYTSVLVDGLPYLALASPDNVPTPAQVKALQVLTYTFPLLPLMKHLPRPSPAPTARNQQPQAQQGAGGRPVQVIRRWGINVRVGGAPALPRVPEQQNGEPRVVFDDEDPRAYFPPVPEFRFQFQFQLPPGRILLQLLFTMSRAALLIYFFPPARQPLWLGAIIAWLGWEVYVVLRHTAVINRRAGQQQQAGDGVEGQENGVNGAPAAALDGAPGNGNNAGGANPGAGGAAPAADAGVAAGPNPPASLAADPNANELARLVDRVANMNLAGESKALSLAVQPPRSAAGSAPIPGRGPPAPESPDDQRPPELGAVEAAVEPSLVHRSTTFLALFITSLIPAIWERRRARLRQRERWVQNMFVLGLPTETPSATTTTPAAGGEAPPQPTGDELAKRRVEALAGWRRAYVERVISGEAGDDGEMM